jgi:hypothetical protein
MHANSELTAIAWLKTIEGLPTNAIGTTLPMGEDGSVPSWVSTGFVQVIVSGRGTSQFNHGYRAPVITAHCWAASAKKQRPPWNQANDLAETIWEACLVEGNGIENLTLPVNVTQPPKVRILQTWGIQEPRRMPYGFPTMGRGQFINPGNSCQYTVDFQIAWAELPQ